MLFLVVLPSRRGSRAPNWVGRLPLRQHAVEHGVGDKPLRIVPGVRAVDHSERRCPPGDFLAGLSEGGTLPTAYVHHLVGRWAVDGIRYEVASAQLFQRDLAFGELLVDEPELVVLEQDLSPR